MKKLLGLIVVSVISCNKEKTNIEDGYFINDDLKNIVNKVILTDNKSDKISIVLSDKDSIGQITFFGDGFIENCDYVKSIFVYQNKIIALVDYSNTSSFDSLVNISKIKTYSDCNSYIKLLDNNVFKDYLSVSYLYKDKQLFYLNGYPIEYKNDTIVLNKFIIE